jgi:hypothetical protein
LKAKITIKEKLLIMDGIKLTIILKIILIKIKDGEIRKILID